MSLCWIQNEFLTHPTSSSKQLEIIGLSASYKQLVFDWTKSSEIVRVLPKVFYLTYKLSRDWIIKYSSGAEQPVSTGESQGNVVGGKQKESCALKEEQVLKKYNKWFVTMWWDFLYIWHDWTSRLTPIQSYPTISSLFSSPQKWSYDFPPFSWSSSHIFNST